MALTDWFKKFHSDGEAVDTWGLNLRNVEPCLKCGEGTHRFDFAAGAFVCFDCRGKVVASERQEDSTARW